MRNYYLNGKILNLDKLIGEGGEGKVFLSSGNLSKAYKIYNDQNDISRASKIQRMVSLELATKSNLISFPEHIITSDNGKVVGFSMNYVVNHQQIHNLYGVKSRKLIFPEADYKFLIRVATNVARAIAQVHLYPCVIGDINHSGILVSKNATVALIDADSFQLKDNNQLFPCVVGVPDFTPPELQGKSLRNVERTQTHDQFGLAVLIFQILMMGRHPFAGRGRDLTLEESIAQFLYAYKSDPNNGVYPPPGVPSISDFPKYIINAFEFSFGISGTTKRTTASEWVLLLQELENNLQKCKTNSKHFYPSTAQSCTWCKMENQTSAILFLGGVSHNPSSVSIDDIELFVAEIKNFSINESNLFPKLPSLSNLKPSLNAQKLKRKTLIKKIGLKFFFTITIISIISMFISKNGFILFVSVLTGYISYLISRWDIEDILKSYKSIENNWNTEIQRWREKALADIYQSKNNIEQAFLEIRDMQKAKDRKLSLLKSSHREKQLNDYLDKFLIKNEKIDHIHKSLVASLASYGIESAADIDFYKIRNIPQFGDKRTKNLVAWKNRIEKNFIYNPTLQTTDVSEQNRIINEFELKLKDKKYYINLHRNLFIQSRSNLNNLCKNEHFELGQIFSLLEQYKVDLVYLGLTIPVSPHVTTNTNKTILKSTSTYNSSGNSWGNQNKYNSQNSKTANHASSPNCPLCMQPMVKRWGKRGGFWGCTKYPTCRGTRNY